MGSLQGTTPDPEMPSSLAGDASMVATGDQTILVTALERNPRRSRRPVDAQSAGGGGGGDLRRRSDLGGGRRLQEPDGDAGAEGTAGSHLASPWWRKMGGGEQGGGPGGAQGPARHCMYMGGAW
jgi:hypothetical protein